MPNPKVLRCANGASTEKSLMAQDVALGLSGLCALPQTVLAQNVTWQKGDAVLIGDAAVRRAISARGVRKICVEQVVSHGKAASVSGRMHTEKGPRLFCHMITFSSAAARQVASIISFEHPLKAPKHER